MIAAALWMPHEWDWQAFKLVSSRFAPVFSPEVSIVDVDWNGSDAASLRRAIAEFLNGLVKSNQRPDAVILDIEFVPCQSNPCGAPMASARGALIASIRWRPSTFPFTQRKSPVSEAATCSADPSIRWTPHLRCGERRRADAFHEHSERDGLFYRICYSGVPFLNDAGAIAGTENVWAMVVRALMTPREFAGAPQCDGSHIPVRLVPVHRLRQRMSIGLPPDGPFRIIRSSTTRCSSSLERSRTIGRPLRIAAGRS